MHMWMWFGYDVGELLFQGLHIDSKGAFAGACIVLFIVAFLFEGSKVIVARTQRVASRKLYPHRHHDERRDLLWETNAGTPEAGPSQIQPLSHHTLSPKYRILINMHQTVLYMLHNTAGYVLMLTVMLYNVYLILAVVLGMVLGYFVFGPMLTKLQMECFLKESPYCTPECDENAEGTTPPLLHTSLSSESDFFLCQTQSCAPIATAAAAAAAAAAPPRDHSDNTKNCYYGAKRCPSKVAVAKRLSEAVAGAGPSRCDRDVESDKDAESQNVEDVKLLLSEKNSCCKESSPPDPAASEPVIRIVTPEKSCCSPKKPNSIEENVASQEGIEAGVDHSKLRQVTDSNKPISDHDLREDSPQISCCHNAKLTPSDSEEHIASV